MIYVRVCDYSKKIKLYTLKWYVYSSQFFKFYKKNDAWIGRKLRDTRWCLERHVGLRYHYHGSITVEKGKYCE